MHRKSHHMCTHAHTLLAMFVLVSFFRATRAKTVCSRLYTYCNGIALFSCSAYCSFTALQSGTGCPHPKTRTTLRLQSSFQTTISVVGSNGCFGATPSPPYPLPHFPFYCSHRLTFTWWGCYGLCLIPNELAHSFILIFRLFPSL